MPFPPPPATVSMIITAMGVCKQAGGVTVAGGRLNFLWQGAHRPGSGSIPRREFDGVTDTDTAIFPARLGTCEIFPGTSVMGGADMLCIYALMRNSRSNNQF